ncbi:TPA: VOC family protein [Pseudomonas aeruginosa]
MVKSKAGPMMQIAYVVEDIDLAVKHWAEKLGVAPFFVTRHAKYETLTYQAEPTGCDITLAFAYSGDLQIELVQQHNDAPSVFREFVQRNGYGMHHVGVLTEDLQADVRSLAGKGVTPVQHCISELGVEAIYLDSDFHPGGMLELIQATSVLKEAFSFMKDAADTWDGSSPYLIEY